MRQFIYRHEAIIDSILYSIKYIDDIELKRSLIFEISELKKELNFLFSHKECLKKIMKNFEILEVLK